MWGLFQAETKQLPGEGGNTDAALLAAARRNDTVGTAQPINGFFPATASDVEQAKEGLSQRRQQSQNFRKCLSINLQHQEVDITDTKALTAWRVATDRNIKKKGLLVARGAARQQVLAAQFTNRVQQLQQSTNEQVNSYQSRKQQAKRRVHQPA